MLIITIIMKGDEINIIFKISSVGLLIVWTGTISLAATSSITTFDIYPLFLGYRNKFDVSINRSNLSEKPIICKPFYEEI